MRIQRLDHFRRCPGVGLSATDVQLGLDVGSEPMRRLRRVGAQVHTVKGSGRVHAIRILRGRPEHERPAHAVADDADLVAACGRLALDELQHRCGIGEHLGAVERVHVLEHDPARVVARSHAKVTQAPVIEIGEHDEVAGGTESPRHVVQLAALARRIHVEEHDRMRPALFGMRDERVHCAVGRLDIEFAVDHACPLRALLKHEPQRDKYSAKLDITMQKPEVPMRFAPTVITALCAFACASATTADTATLPDAAKLKSMEARFAPVDVRVDVSRSAGRGARGARAADRSVAVHRCAVHAAALAGQRSAAAAVARGRRRRSGARASSYFLLNKGPWSELDEDRPFVPGRRDEAAAGGNFYPARRDARRGRCLDEVAARAHSTQRRTGFFTTIRRDAGRQVDGGAVLARVPGRARRDGAPAARSCGADAAADAEVVPRKARRRVRQQRLLRERRRLDGARRVDRADDRAVRGLRGRVVQLQGGVRVVHHAHRRGRDHASSSASAASCRSSRTTCRSTRSSAARSSAATRRSASSTSCSPPATRNHGVQTAAFNLPNDERVVAEKGSKRVLLKNFQQAKFEKVLVPIAKRRARAERPSAASRSKRSSRTS